MKERIEAGTTIHTEKPFVYILKSNLRTQRCDFCFNENQLLKCTVCKYVYYCGKVCQKEGWYIHKHECKNLKKIAPRVVPDAARLLSRLVQTLNRGGDKVLSYYTEIKFRMYKDLMSHYPDLKADNARMEHFESLCHVLNEYLGDDLMPNPVELLGMFGRMVINSFNILNQELHSLGTGIYLGASVIDHSCEPNAIALFEGTTLNIRTIRPMKFLDWTKVHISYIDLLSIRKERQEELKMNYYFQCECFKCLQPEPIEEMLGAACPNKKCDAALDLENVNVNNCPKCGEIVPEDFKDNFREVTEFTKVNLENMKQQAYLDVCLVCLKKQEGLFHRYNLKYVKILDMAFHSCIEFGKFEEAKNLGIRLIDPYYKYYGKINPFTGLLHLALGKILHYQENLPDCLDHLKKAYDILKITHGPKSTLFRKELMPLLNEATLENNLRNSL